MAGAASRCAGSGTLPVIGLQTQVPEPERLAWYAGLGLMAFQQLTLARFCWMLIPVQILIYDRTLKPRKA